MKIGILTLPLHENYGGILQAFALQHHLLKLGHEAYHVQLKHVSSWKYKLKLRIIQAASIITFKQFWNKSQQPKTQPSSLNHKSHFNSFIKDNLSPMTEPISGTSQLVKLKKYGFEAYIVGSDQVWRKEYSFNYIYSYFLDFVKDPALRISYAASFGLDDWQFNKSQTNKITKLVKKFTAISVREENAVTSCRDHLGVKALHVIDPTLLLSPDDYINLLSQANAPLHKPYLYSYVLDQAPEKIDIIHNVATQLGMTRAPIHEEYDSIQYFPSIEQWLKNIASCEYLVTDSFHGTVFAILFNKNFISIANESRGMSRFRSLLRMFDLEDRLVKNTHDALGVAGNKINWESVNQQLANQRSLANSFLLNSLGSQKSIRD